MLIESIAVATAQLTVSLITDARLRKRKARRRRAEQTRSVAQELGLPMNVVLGVEAWLERSDVAARLAQSTEASLAADVAACVAALRYELATAGAASDDAFAEEVAILVANDPALRLPGSSTAELIAIERIDELQEGQATIYGVLLEDVLRRYRQTRRRAEDLLADANFEAAAAEFESAADEARTLGAAGAEARELSRAVGCKANQAYDQPELRNQLADQTVRLVARHNSLVDAGPSHWRLASIPLGLRGDFQAVEELAERVYSHDESTVREIADAWIQLISAGLRTKNKALIRTWAARRPPASGDPEVSLATAAVMFKALSVLDKIDEHAIADLVQQVAFAVGADAQLAKRALIEVDELRFRVPNVELSEPLLQLMLYLSKLAGNRVQEAVALLALAVSPSRDGKTAKVRELVGGARNALAQDPPNMVTIGQVEAQIGPLLLQCHASAHPDGGGLDLLDEAQQSLARAKDLARDAGAPKEVLASLEIDLGRAAVFGGDLKSAMQLFEAAERIDPARRHSPLQMRADLLLATGNWEEARAAAVDVAQGVPDTPAGNHAERLLKHVEKYVEPLLLWLDSDDSAQVRRQSLRESPRSVATEYVANLLELWDSPFGGGAEAWLLDYWGRGSFMPIAQALSTSPLGVVTIDAATVEEVRLAARILCPIFETVVVKWCGEVMTGLGIGPLPAGYDGPGGWHGYEMVNETIYETDEHGNLGDDPVVAAYTLVAQNCSRLPDDLIALLTGEGRGLLASGRLLVVPAGLVGCHTRGIGWTDGVLADRVLGGAVVAGTRNTQIDQTLDLAAVLLPYPSRVPLSQLGSLLDELESTLTPYRQRVFELVATSALDKSNWAGRRAVQLEIEHAFREFNGEFTTETGSHGEAVVGQQLNLQGAHARPLAVPSGTSGSLLGATLRGESPWFPLWRLTDSVVDWTPARTSSSTHQSSADSATWLCPGSMGLTTRLMIS